MVLTVCLGWVETTAVAAVLNWGQEKLGKLAGFEGLASQTQGLSNSVHILHTFGGEYHHDERVSIERSF